MSLEKSVQYNQVHQMQPLKNPGIAAVLSFFLPGLGQIYNGQIIWGIIVMVVVMPLTFLIMLGLLMRASPYDQLGNRIQADTPLLLLPLLLPVVVWIGNVVSAYKSAERANRKRYIPRNDA